MTDKEYVQYQPLARCPLDGVRVLDLSRLVAGNMLTLQLADFGAEVIKLEPHRGDPLRDWKENGISLFWKVYSRNKKSVRLDLKRPEDKERFKQLVPTSHVVVESFRPGVMEALGLGPDVVLKLNPRVVMVRVSGWGQTGPYQTKPGFGSLVEAMSGFAAKTGFEGERPVLPNMALADMVAGLYGAYSVLVALRESERPGGQGQVIDLSLLEPLHSILGPDAAVFRLTGRIPARAGNRISITAPRNVYATADGGWLALSASTQAMAERLFKVIGRSDLIEDMRFRTNSARLEHVEELDAIIQNYIGKSSLAENLAFFDAAQVTVGPVYDAQQFERDPHVRERGVLVQVADDQIGSLLMHSIIPRFSATPGALRYPAPELGEHEAEILGSLPDLDMLDLRTGSG
jgi:crotonobetainyl-CoA:carnitine CoA-transferase CaiB-like acyl-CoA transferase